MILDLLSFPFSSPQLPQKSLKLVLFEIVDWEWQTLKKLESDYHLIETQDRLTPENALHYKDADIISTCVHSELNKLVLQQLPNLKLIMMRSPNYASIDHQYCQDYQISVCNVQSYFPLL